jgi:hypothetical protein
MELKKKLLIAAACATFVLGAVAVYNNPTINKKITERFTKEIYVEVPVEREPETLSPEQQHISHYITGRYSRTPVEIARLISAEIIKQSEAHDLPSVLITAIIEQESMFNPSATSQITGTKDTAKGLMQIYKAESIEVDQDQAYDLSYNISVGCQILKKKLELNNGNLEKALSNYSGNTEGYTSGIYENVGRITLYGGKF